MSKTTVEKYLDLLEKVFVIYRLGAYSRNLRKGGYKSWQVVLLRQRHSQCHYRGFLTAGHSAGCRCAVGELHPSESGAKRTFNEGLHREFYFWRTYDKQEIDLIEESADSLTRLGVQVGK